MADLERELEEPGTGAQAPKTLGRWVHRHGASAERVAEHAGDPDPELSFTGIFWTAAGIAGVTALAMVLMIWLLGGMTDYLTARERAATPAEIERRDAVRRAGEERVAAEPVPSPGLAVPADLEVPPGPRLELHPTWNLERLRAIEDELLGGWAAAAEPAGAVRIPIETAIELAAAGELPGVPRGAAARDGEPALQEAGERELGTLPEADQDEEEPAPADPATEEPHAQN
jgi:hypothetical protein